MEERKHTPGPWSINEWKQRDASIRIGAKGTPIIAEVPLKYVSINEQQANAELIVRACNSHEELLAACKYVVKYHRDNDSGEGELFGLDFVTTCIAAIAKATGDN